MPKAQPDPSGDDCALRSHVVSGRPAIGTFVKTASHQTVEVLGLSGLDYVVLDAEHAPFGPETLDRAIACARGASLPVLVRVPNHSPAFINACLDMGASGILVPHVRSAADAKALVRAVKYEAGERGFSPSTRAGRYGTADGKTYRREADRRSTLWCQIEDAEAMDALDDIAAVDEVDCLFIGPADLSLSLGLDGPNDPRLLQAIESIVDAGRRHQRATGMFVSSTGPIAELMQSGITVFLCGSDQAFLLSRAQETATAFARQCANIT